MVNGLIDNSFIKKEKADFSITNEVYNEVPAMIYIKNLTLLVTVRKVWTL